MAMTAKQAAAREKATAAAKRKRDEEKRRREERARVRKVPIPRPETAPEAAPETAPESGAPVAPTAGDRSGGSGPESVPEAAAPAAEAAALAAPDALAPPAAPEAPPADVAERRARYARLRRQIGQHAPAHYLIHRGVTARAFRLVGRRVAGVELGQVDTIAYQTQPSGDVRPVATTVDRALALSVSELGAYLTSGVALEAPLAPMVITAVLAFGAIITARFGAERDGHAADPSADFRPVDEAALKRAAEEAARGAESQSDAA